MRNIASSSENLRYILASYLLRWSFDLIPGNDLKVRLSYGGVFKAFASKANATGVRE